jgi:hypothetical protein
MIASSITPLTNCLDAVRLLVGFQMVDSMT